MYRYTFVLFIVLFIFSCLKTNNITNEEEQDISKFTSLILTMDNSIDIIGDNLEEIVTVLEKMYDELEKNTIKIEELEKRVEQLEKTK